MGKNKPLHRVCSVTPWSLKRALYVLQTAAHYAVTAFIQFHFIATLLLMSTLFQGFPYRSF